MRSCGKKTLGGLGCLVVAMVLLAAGVQHAQSQDASLYKEALTREAALRADLAALAPTEPPEPLYERIRVMVGAYEDLALLFPESEYGDNALWQGGQLAFDLFARSGNNDDRTDALRLFDALAERFPDSPLAANAAASRARLATQAVTPSSPIAVASSPPSAPSAPSAPSTPPPSAPLDRREPDSVPPTAGSPRRDAPEVPQTPRPAPTAPASTERAPAASPNTGQAVAPGRQARAGETPAPTPARPTPPDPPVATASRAVPPPAVPRAATKPAAPRPPAILRAVHSELRPQVVRITLALEREVTFSERRLVDPPRVFVDLHDVAPSAAVENATVALGDPIVRRLRVVPLPGRRTQIAIDLVAPADYSVYALYNPFRLVIDFERRGRRTAAAGTGGRGAAATGSAAVIGSAAPRPPSANAAGGFSLSRQLGLRAARIVIDPGHGGHDPGAESAGLTEAALVLDVALRLERLLTQGNHAEVVLTRRDDTFVPLEERTATANRGEADLFLSIHANAHAAGAVRGVETYVLNFAATPEAEALAARENAASSRSMRELPDLVRAIAADNKLDESRDFARIVQRTLYQRLRTVNKGLKNLGVKQAPFMVLVGARMPAILAEIAFMTNRQDAALLRTDRYRQQIAEALLAGITGYQETLKKVALAGGS